jgi:hypothetical protein
MDILTINHTTVRIYHINFIRVLALGDVADQPFLSAANRTDRVENRAASGAEIPSGRLKIMADLHPVKNYGSAL